MDVNRRIAPMKVTVSLLYRLLDQAKDSREVVIDRNLLEAVINTLDLVAEDIGARSRAEEGGRKVVEGPAARIATAAPGR
jgi:hypothetical protein